MLFALILYIELFTCNFTFPSALLFY